MRPLMEECALNEFVFQAWWLLDFVGYNHSGSVPILLLIEGVQSEAEVVRWGRLRWFGHVERKSGDD